METIEAFDQTKENIQPLTQGRITSQFGAALNAQTNPGVHQEQRKKIEFFELQLRTYEGDDPLCPWYDYISWIEQSFPKGGKEGNLYVVLEKCLAKFKDVPQYMQDTRFVKLWLKYIDTSVEVSRNELYQFAHSHGVGTQSALFYRFWAYEYEKCQDFKTAEQIYENGFAHHAQPAEELLKAHTDFMKSVTRLTLHGNVLSPHRPDIGLPDQRQVLNALRPHGHNSHLVRNVRVGSNVIRSESKMPLMQANANRGPKASLKIFSDDNDGNIETNIPSNPMGVLPRPTIMNKENSLKPGPWSGPTGRKKSKPTPTIMVPDRPIFNVHTDEVTSEARASHPLYNVAKPLKTIKLEPVPCFVAEPYDPTKIPMYAKDKVYDGSVELSFEELRAARYLKKEKERKASNRDLLFENISGDSKETSVFSSVITDNNDLLVQNLSNLNISKCRYKDSDNVDAKLVAQVQSERQVYNAPFIENYKVPKSEMGNNYDNKTLLLFKEHVVKPSTKVLSASNCSKTVQVSSSLQEIRDSMLSQVLPSNIVEATAVSQHHSERPTVDHPERQRHLTCNVSTCSSEASMLHSQSITVNTKEAMSEMYELWGSNKTPPQEVSEVGLPKENVNIERPTEISMASSDIVGSRFSGHQEYSPDKLLPFHIYTDDAEGDPKPLRNNEDSGCPGITQQQLITPPFEIYSDNVFSSTSAVKQEAKICNVMSTNCDSYVEPKDDALNSTRPDIKNDDNVATLPTQQKFITPFEIYSDNIFTSVTQQDSKISCVVSTNFEIYDEQMEPSELPPMPSSIPIVPSPGMSPSEIRALEGTDSKENQIPMYYEMPEDDERELTGVLQPSSVIPFVPIIEQASEEPEYSNITCVTQAFTQAFKFPLSSSTPFHGNMPPLSEDSENTSLYLPSNVNDDRAETATELKNQEPMACHTVTYSQGPINLSVIMENSKEFNYKSSSSSGSSSNATTRRTFSHAQWSSRDSFVPEYSNKSEFRNKDSLAAIKENESFKSVGSKEQSSFEKSFTTRSEMKDEVFNMDLFQSPVVSLEVKHSSFALQGKMTEYDAYAQQTHKWSAVDPFFTVQSLKDNTRSVVETLKIEEHELSTQHYRNSFRSDYDGPETDVTSQNEDVDNPCSKVSSVEKAKDSIERDVSNTFNTSVATSCVSPEKYNLDPFDVSLISELLNKIKFLDTLGKSYIEVQKVVPVFKPGTKYEVGTDTWEVINVLGKGAYAKVYKMAVELGKESVVKAFKVQKPSWIWEMYISNEIHRRLQDDTLDLAFMNISKCYAFTNGSVMVSEYLQYGTLLAAVNKLKSNPQFRNMIEPLAIFWTVEMLRIIEQLHACQIIHGDIKPDNFLLRSLPSNDTSKPSLQLIDFGRSIDLLLFPQGTCFNYVVTTKDFQCIEMQTGKPWTYQTDLYGVASSLHCILFGEYMKVSCSDGKWCIQKKFPRNFNDVIWHQLFNKLLNIKSCKEMPDLKEIRHEFEKLLKNLNFGIHFTSFSNIMRGH